MTEDDFLRLGQVAIETAVLVSAPILALGLIAGLMVSVFQAATQINDSSLAFIPKIGAAVVALLVFGHFIMNRIAGFTIWAYSQIGSLSP